MADSIVRVKNGLEADRANIVPAVGEWIFATDSKRTYMGDGTTPGGVSADTKHHEVETSDGLSSVPFASDGDTCDVTESGNIYIRVNDAWVEIYSSQFPQISWTAATLSTGWSNVGGTMAPARFTKQGNWVMIEGGCSRTDKQDLIFILPVGFRPEFDIITPVFGHTGLMRIDIKPNGEVRLQTNGSVDWVSFCIQFAVGG